MTTYVGNRDGGKTNEAGHIKALTDFFTEDGQGQVVRGFNVGVPATLGMTVTVAIGSALVRNGNYCYQAWTDAAESVRITTADPSNPRIDVVVAYVDISETPQTANPNNPGMLKFTAVTGTPAASPVAPTNTAISTAISNNPWVYLASVAVAAGVTQISSTNITDGRQLAKILSSNVSFATLSKINTWSGPETYGTTVHCQRTGNHVDLNIDGFTNNYMPASGTSVETIPVGFRPLDGSLSTAPLRVSPGTVGVGRIDGNGRFAWWLPADPGNNTEVTFHTSYCTTDAWPTVGTNTDVTL